MSTTATAAVLPTERDVEAVERPLLDALASFHGIADRAEAAMADAVARADAFAEDEISRAKFERTEKLAASVHRVARELNEVSNRLWQTIEPGLAAIDEAAKPSDG